MRTLRDPVSGEEFEPGTPDLLCLHRTLPKLHVVDWKKRAQMFAGHLPAPDENPQQLYYLAAAWLEIAATRKIEEGQIVTFWGNHACLMEGYDRRTMVCIRAEFVSGIVLEDKPATVEEIARLKAQEQRIIAEYESKRRRAEIAQTAGTAEAGTRAGLKLHD
jgi:hypothetical protein